MFFSKREHPYTSAVIAAAGESSRFGRDKLEMLLDGESVVMKTVRAFEECGLIDEIVISTREDKIAELYSDVRENGFKKVRAIVSGGKTRQASVKNAVEAVSEKALLLCIHDGARPLVTEDVIFRTLEAAQEYGCATAAVPVKNTIKIADGEGFAVSTPERSTLWEIQTPQCFKKEIYCRAVTQALSDFTDDCQLVESIGGKVKLVMGDYRNIKLTTPEDILTAQIFSEGWK